MDTKGHRNRARHGATPVAVAPLTWSQQLHFMASYVTDGTRDAWKIATSWRLPPNMVTADVAGALSDLVRRMRHCGRPTGWGRPDARPVCPPAIPRPAHVGGR
jgi:hypothetical protein